MARLLRYRVVADACPLKEKDCSKCRYNNGFDFNMKTYCYYGDKECKEWIKLWRR